MIEPALTAEEWAKARFETQELWGEALVRIEHESDDDVYITHTSQGAFFHGADRQRLAALALYGHPSALRERM